MVEQTFLPVTLVYWGHIFVLFFLFSCGMYFLAK